MFIVEFVKTVMNEDFFRDASMYATIIVLSIIAGNLADKAWKLFVEHRSVRKLVKMQEIKAITNSIENKRDLVKLQRARLRKTERSIQELEKKLNKEIGRLDKIKKDNRVG